MNSPTFKPHEEINNSSYLRRSLATSLPQTTSSIGIFILLTCSVIFFLTLYLTAWMDEDAFITLRVADNFVRGYGLRWNINERVLAVTHPLWLMVISFFLYFTSSLYIGTIFICMMFSTLAALWICLALSRRGSIVTATFLICLCCSKSWMDYASAGLENPLEYFLIALLFTSIPTSKLRKISTRLVFPVSSLLILTRFDLIVLLIPFFVSWLRSKTRHEVLIRDLWLALAMPMAWCTFSLLYFGSLLPNPMLAKIDYFNIYDMKWFFGISHILIWMCWDPIGAAIVAIGCSTSIFRGDQLSRALARGTMLYIIVFAVTGGDYQIGRAMSVCVFINLTFLLEVHSEENIRIYSSIIFLALFVGITHPRSPWQDSYWKPGASLARDAGLAGFIHRPFSDERFLMFNATGLRLISAISFDSWLHDNPWLSPCKDQEVISIYGAGLNTWLHCRTQMLVDGNALTDGFLSRLPPIKRPFVPGHCERAIPPEYINSLQQNENKFIDPAMRSFYQEYREVTSGPLFASSRLKLLPKFALLSIYPPLRNKLYNTGDTQLLKSAMDHLN